MATVRTSVPGSGYGNVYVDSLVWGGAAWDLSSGPIKVWLGQPSDFAAASSVHTDGGVEWDGTPAYDWTEAEEQVFTYALGLYQSVSGLRFEVASSVKDANIVWWKTQLGDGTLGLHERPQAGQIWGYFDATMPSWSNMQFGGDGLNTVIHELGHAIGLAHPHDGGDQPDRTTFPGATASSSTGRQGLNQGIWTVMSYNSGWDGAGYGLSYGNQGGLGAFDIAALQALYGKNMATGSGDDVYTLPSQSPSAPGEGWFCIWDAGGVDTLSAVQSASSVTLDLRAATLKNGDPHAGGFISLATGFAGGYTIANGVVIENAEGGRRGDTLIGNGSANTLKGNGGSDALGGGGGADTLIGGSGSDGLYGGLGLDSLTGGSGKDVFVFDTKPNKSTNVDSILDFSVRDDSVWLDNKAFAKLGSGTPSHPKKFTSDMFVKAARAHDRDDRVIYDSRKGALYYDADGTGSKYKQVEIATLNKGLKMTYADFFVV